jgi:hypothetical protein
MTFYTNLEQVGRLVSPGARVLLRTATSRAG